MWHFLSNALAFIFALGVIIFVHELGHLLMAKGFGFRVYAFSVGFGKRLWGFRRGETDYRVSLFPLGGYVQLGGEDGQEITDDPQDFLNKPRWQRIAVYLAGPAMNVALSIVLMAIVFTAGIEVSALPNIPPILGGVAEGSPAEEAGLMSGDRVLTVAGQEVKRWDDVQFAFLTSPERSVALTVSRGEETLSLSVTPLRVPKYEFGDAGAFPLMLPRLTVVLPNSPAEAAGFLTGDEIRAVGGRAIASGQDFVAFIEQHAGEAVPVRVLRDGAPVVLDVVPEDEDGKGKIGVGLGYYQKFSPGDALVASVQFNLQVTRQTFQVLGKILTGKLAAKGALSGPIEIAALSGAAARSGVKSLLRLMALVSISIGILNLLPIPVLDGGQITVLLIESLRRKDLSLKVKERINQLGLAFIVVLMVMVLYFDVVKNIPDGLLPGS